MDYKARTKPLSAINQTCFIGIERKASVRKEFVADGEIRQAGTEPRIVIVVFAPTICCEILDA